MYPENNQAPIDYLNQIAPQPHKQGVDKRTLVFIAIGVALILTIVIGLLGFAGSTATSQKTSLQALAARLQATQTIAEGAQTNIKSSNLRGINSNLTIMLTNANRDIASPLKLNHIDTAKLDKTIVAKEKAGKMTASLEDARLNAVFDETYAREMSFKLTTISLLMQQLQDQSNSKSVKDFLAKTDTNLQPIKQQLDDFSTSSR